MLKDLLGILNMFVGAGAIAIGLILGCCECVSGCCEWTIIAILALMLGVIIMAGGAVLFYSEECKNDENKQES